MSDKTYGQYIKDRRNELKLTRKEACDKLSISVQTLTRIEGDKVSISLETLEEFIHLFDVDVSAFLNKEVYKRCDLKSYNKYSKESLSKTIVFLRNREKMSQSELAKRINVSNNKISLWENAKSFPNIIEFKMLCEALNALPDEVFFNKIIPEKRIITLLEMPTKRFVRIFSSFALAIIVGGMGFSSLNHGGNNFLPPHSQVETPELDLDEEIVPTKRYKVTYKYEMINDVVVKEFDEGSKVPFLPLPVSITGYELVDYLYKNQSFDFENYRLNKDITLYGDLEKSTYKVRYFAYDKKTILKEEEVPYLEDATPPSIDVVDVFDDKKFIRWSQNSNKVVGNMDIYPLYDHYKTSLKFIDTNGATYEPMENYSHSSFGVLLKPLSDFSSTFIGWFYNDAPFTLETPLDEKMTLVSKYLKEDVINCSIKLSGKNEMRYFQAGYNLPFLGGFTDGNKLATTFKKDGELLEFPVVFDSNNIDLDPVFDMYIEFHQDENRNILIDEIRSDSKIVYIPNTINDCNVSLIKNEALILPNCSKLVIGAGDIKIEKDAFKHVPNVEELYIKDLKTWNETITLEDDLLSPLTKLKVLELPLAVDQNGKLININTIGLNKDLRGLNLRFQNDFEFNGFFNNANEELLKTISFMKVESINEYPFNRRVEMNNVDLSKFSSLKKLDFVGTINEIHLLNVSKFKGQINYSGSLEILENNKSNSSAKEVYDTYEINSKKDLSLFGNDKIYAKKIKLDSLNSLTFIRDIEFYPLESLYLPEFNKIRQETKKYRFISTVKGNVIDVYIKGKVPLVKELEKYFKGAEDDLTKSFNFISIN